ncbi:TrkA-C domain-containing protein [Halomicrobium zhouii]|uniref:TrkA-C domain-containing protein n=1 Tax=Halomicrobium zhouii TaxID=767519 RepID=A0A1I6KPG9_9EURY|nr:SLC13 family permease [Halomicrobium zhouii]SFR93094.1 TrkA-C domain-containing protein [Halomicrobium zhouii]
MAALSVDVLVVFALILVALFLFVSELVPPDVTAIGVLVSLAVLSPFTKVPAKEAIEGFASPAVVTIMAMYILSAGIEETGIVERLGSILADVTGGDEGLLTGATVATTGIGAGFVNNTPIVAVFIPLITGLSERYGISPSKLLMPLSFAAMLGGTLTLVGTSTNLLASEYARELLGEPLGMFTFTHVGALVLVVGVAYLLTVGRRLVPARIPAAADFTQEFDMDRHLSQLVVRDDSALVGRTVSEALDDARTVPDGGVVAADANGTPEAVAVAIADDIDVDVLQVDRNGESFLAPASDVTIQAGDVLTVRGNPQAVNRFAEAFRLRQLTRETVTEDDLSEGPGDGFLVEAVIPPSGSSAGRPLATLRLRERFDTTVLSLRRGGTIIREELDAVELAPGDTLLLQTTTESIRYLQEAGYLLVTEGPVEAAVSTDPAETPPLDPKAPIALATLVGVVVVAGLELLPIYIAALGGVVAMVASGVLNANRAYDAVGWNVVFLLAGLLPLGVAMQATGGAAVLGGLLVGLGDVLPPVALLAAIYLLTGLLSSIITPVATVVLLTPVAVDTASRLDVAGMPFLLIVMFAASTAFITPIGYQTNLMVYGPGGYKFTDFMRVGLPLQLLLMVVTTLAVVATWPL